MPQFCAVLNCGSNSLRDKVSFFRFPSSTDSYRISLVKKKRREEWIRALKRTDLTESKLKNQRVCEKHFVTGKPAALEETDHPDWIPTLNLGFPTENKPVRITAPEGTVACISPQILLDHNYCLLPLLLDRSPPSPMMEEEIDSTATPSKEEGNSEMPHPPPSEEPAQRPQPPISPPLTPTDETLPSTAPQPEIAVPIKEPQEAPTDKTQIEAEEAIPDSTPTLMVELKEEIVDEGEVEQREREEPIEHSDVPAVETKAKKEKESQTPEDPLSQEVEDSVTRCICGFEHDDGFMICCDKCMVWQHVDCMEIERANIPDEYLCEECDPRKVDKARAVSLQRSKKKLFDEMLKTSAADTPPSSSDQSNSDGENSGGRTNRRKKERKKENSAKKKKAPKLSPNLKKKKVPKREVKTPKKEEDEEDEDSSPDLRSWIDEYEEAITNHYSPELRARVAALKASGLKTDERLLGTHSARPKSKVTHSLGQKMLVAVCNISSSQPIVELRGKYMLAKTTDYGTQPPGSKSRERFVFQYRIPAPGHLATDVQVDASTYGNFARFIRSSCCPNAEIKHCIEKGTLHLYIVSSNPIEARKEITLPHRPGAPCALADSCSLLSGKRRNRKQVLVERSVSRDSALANNNNYKALPAKKRSLSSERPASSKALKTSIVPSYDATAEPSSKSYRSKATLRSAIPPAANTRRTDLKTRSQKS